MCDPSLSDVPLPSGWASNVRSAVLHVISLAQYAMVTVRGWAANSLNARVRLPGAKGLSAVGNGAFGTEALIAQVQ